MIAALAVALLLGGEPTRWPLRQMDLAFAEGRSRMLGRDDGPMASCIADFIGESRVPRTFVVRIAIEESAYEKWVGKNETPINGLHGGIDLKSEFPRNSFFGHREDDLSRKPLPVVRDC